MTTLYYYLSEAIKFSSQNTYIVGLHEDLGKHYFLSFTTFDDFLIKKSKYKSLHELMITPNENMSEQNKGKFCQTNRIDGRLCFDFDFRPTDKINIIEWKEIVEITIKKVSELLYIDFDPNKLEFIWSTSDNSTKISKHLTVKGLYYQDWIPMSKQFYEYFIKNWNNCLSTPFSTSFIDANIFVDKQIIRANGSLRFVGSTKPNGNNKISLDNNIQSFIDSMIRPPTAWNYSMEQSISYEQLKISVFNLPSDIGKININKMTVNESDNDKIQNNDPDSFMKAFKFINKFETDDGNTILDYRRKYSSMCPICMRTHDNQNAFIKISNGITTFHCYQNLQLELIMENNSVDQKKEVFILNSKKITSHNEYVPLSLVI